MTFKPGQSGNPKGRTPGRRNAKTRAVLEKLNGVADAPPIVFSSATDPVQLGLVASLNRPGGNATGVFILTNDLEAKRLGLLQELVPSGTIAVLVNPQTPGADAQLSEVHSAAHALSRPTIVLNASS